MSALTTTQVGAFDAFLGLLEARAALQNPAPSVFDTQVVQYEPGDYIGLWGFEDHEFEVAALGTLSQYERFAITGVVTHWQGDVNPKAVRDATFALYDNVVMAVVIANAGLPGGNQVLGPAAPASLEWIIPLHARYTASPGDVAGGQSGFQGTLDFAFGIHARITVA